MRKTQTIGLMAIMILACAVAAIPIDPNQGTGGAVPLPAGLEASIGGTAPIAQFGTGGAAQVEISRLTSGILESWSPETFTFINP